MIWLTWRQFRTQAWVGAAILLIVAGAALATAPHLFDRYHDSGFADCTANCSSLADAFIATVRGLSTVVYIGGTAALFLLPPLIGVFWGAPMVARELETGTHRLVWSQSISRNRWMAVKLAGVGGATAAVSGLISLVMTWWARPVDAALQGRVVPLVFSARGVVPIAYALLAFAIGVLAGLAVRRTVLAMGITLLLVALVQVATPLVIRPLIASPVQTSTAFDPDRIERIGIGEDGSATIRLTSPVQGGWVLTNRTVDASGREFTGPMDETKCGRQDSGPRACEDYLATLGLRQEVSYVSPGQFWGLQWREFGFLAGVTAIFVLFAVWWLRRRTA